MRTFFTAPFKYRRFGAGRRSRWYGRGLAAIAALDVLLPLCALAAPPKSAEGKASDPSPVCTAYLIADANSGSVLDASDPDTPRPPASMVKLMTAYVILKKIREKGLTLEDVVSVTAEASKIGGSQVFLKEGEQFSVKQLLEALMIQSANDAAVALSIHVAGSREAFVEMMNEEAKAIGMLHSEFHSPHGLPPAKEQLPDLVSPSDFLILSRHLVKEYPEILQVTAVSELGFRDNSFVMRNHNHLLRTISGSDGLKTGYYDKAGFCVTHSAVKNGIRLIGVLMGCPSRKIRDTKATELFTKAFLEYKKVDLLKAGQGMETSAKVASGSPPEVLLQVASDVAVTVKKSDTSSVQKKVSPCTNLTAPVSKGTKCGTVTFHSGGTQLAKADLVVSQDVAQAGLTERMLQKFGF